jgi:acetyl esterase/lipase
MLRQGGIDLTADLPSLRAAFEQLAAAVPVAADLTRTPRAFGGVDAVEVTVGDRAGEDVILYFHGGAYVVGSAAASVPLVGELVRRTGARAVTVEYRLAPENPHPAALDDARAIYEALLAQGLLPGRIAFAGESAGAGLVMATLLALRDAGTPLPACAVLMSPYADLTLSGESVRDKQALDPILTPDGLRLRVRDYAADADPADPHISPIFGDLRGLPPLLIQVGSHEVLLSDAVRLAARAAIADVPVTLEVVAGVPHVFQGFAGMLDEADAALDRASTFVQAAFASAALARTA